jgi:hypothetical protein
MKHKNQIVVGDRGRRDVGEEVRQVGGAWGKRDTIVLAEIRTTKNIYIQYTLALDGLLIDYFTHNNQPKTRGAMKESRERRRDYRGAWGWCKSIVLAAIERVG